MDVLTNEEVLSILLFLDRDNLETLQQTNKRLTTIVADFMNDVCLRYFEYVDLFKAGTEEGLSVIIQHDENNVHVIEPKKNTPSITETFAKYLRMSSVGRLSFNECTITPELCEALNDVSPTILINSLGVSFIHFGVDLDAFHAMIRGFRCVKEFYISTDYADCVNDELLTGLAVQGATKFSLVAYKDRDSSQQRPQCGISDEGLLEFCFRNGQGNGMEKRTVRLECMRLSDDFFAKVICASKEAENGNDVEMEIETTTRTLHKFPSECEVSPAVEAGRNLYKYAFVDGKPRNVLVELRFNDTDDHSTMGPCFRTAKRRPGRLHQEVLIITFS